MTDARPRRSCLLILPALLGAAILLYATAVYAVGLDRDGVAYMNSARNLLARGALVTTFAAGPPQPFTHWPPLYPALLASLHLVSADVIGSARLLNAFLFAAYIVAIQLLALRATDDSLVAALWAGFYVALSTAALGVYARMWSETLFLALFLFGLLALFRYLDAPAAGSLFVAAGLFALAWLARYVGVTLVITGGIAIVLWGRGSLRRRMRGMALFVVAASVPIALYMLRNYVVSGNPADRTLGFHPVPAAWWGTGVYTLSAWLLPVASPAPLRWAAALAVGAVGLAALYFAVQDSRRAPVSHSDGVRRWLVPAVLLIFSALYVGFFAAVATFADTGNVNMRTLSPVFSALAVAAAYAGYETVRGYGAARPALVAGVLITLCTGLLAVQGVRSAVWARNGRADGFEYNGRAWATAPTLERLRALPEDAPLYANVPEIVYLLTGRRAYPLAFASCSDGCAALAEDLDAVPDARRTTAVIVWAAGEGRTECLPCLTAAAPAYGFVSAYHDERFQLFVGGAVLPWRRE